MSVHYATDHTIGFRQEARICKYCDQRFDERAGLSHHLAKSAQCAQDYERDLGMSYSAAQQDFNAGSSRSRTRIDSDEEMGSGADELEDEEMLSNRDTEDEYTDEHTVPDVGGHTSESPEDFPLPKDLPFRGTETFIERHPNPHAGAPIRRATAEERRRRDHAKVGRLGDPDLFAVAEVLMTSGLSAKKRDQFLKLNRDIDNLLPRGPKWRIETFEVAGSNGAEVVDLWVCDSLESIRDLLFDSQFADDMHYVPQREWTGPDKRKRKWGETWTANRMWRLQSAIRDPQATVIPYFVSSDETVLTVLVGDLKAHPVYLTIGNIPKHVQRETSKRGMLLIGYLPVTKLDCETNEEKQRILKRKLLHTCMSKILEPLAEAGEHGAEAVCSDGEIRRIYPIFSGAMLDFPEQCKYACIKQPMCPTCQVPPDERGDFVRHPLRKRDETIKAIKEYEEGSARFEDLGLILVLPFWEDLPYVKAGTMFPPDLLHQMYKGVFKDHLAKWSTQLVGERKMDDMYKAMSPHHGLRHFKRGISKVSQWTGREVKEQVKLFLPTLVNEEPEAIAAGRALVKFMFLAHSSSLTDDDLTAMNAALEEFHQNKVVFKELRAFGPKDEARAGSHQWFNGIPKLHSLLHYVHYIRELGTPDGYNTELPERLHIPYAKQGWRASNKKDATKQMAIFIQRAESIAMHRAYLNRFQASEPEDEDGNGDNYEGDAVEFGPMRRLSLGREVVETDEEEEAEPEETEETDEPEDDGRGDVDEEEETELERIDVEANGTWEEIDNTSAANVVPRGGGGSARVPIPSSRFYPNAGPTIAKSNTTLPLYSQLTEQHSADRLFPAINSFLRKRGHKLSADDANTAQASRFKVWHRCKFIHSPPPYKPTEAEKIDTVRAFPAVEDAYGRQQRPAQFDTVLCLLYPEDSGLHRYRAARVRVIFELPTNIHHLFPHKLAFVELFTKFTGPDDDTGLYQTSPSATDTKRDVAVLPLSLLKMSCHLPPRFGTATKHLDLATENDILNSCKKFFFNEYGSFFTFELLHHWRTIGALHSTRGNS